MTIPNEKEDEEQWEPFYYSGWSVNRPSTLENFMQVGTKGKCVYCMNQ